MKILVYSPIGAAAIEDSLGRADYSYRFVLAAYLPVLASLAEVEEIRDPREADNRYASCQLRGEHCVLLYFAPPHSIALPAHCPVIPVFAWEYDDLPDESWRTDRPTDWVRALGRTGWAITHSRYAIEVTRRSVRPDYPVVSAPAPVWDRFAPLAAGRARLHAAPERRVPFNGFMCEATDVQAGDTAASLLERLPPGPGELRLSGTVYTAVFGPLDGRKNFEDLLSAFCWAFRDEPRCTLLMKLVHHDRDEALTELLRVLRRLPACAARLVVLHAYLDETQYAELVRASDFAVNSSLGEGQCLPLMEFMSAGVPAIAPAHTAMLDYLDNSCGFPVRAFREWCNWPHDLRLVFRTWRHCPDWESLEAAYRASHALRTGDPAGYWQMCRRASERQRVHCSAAVVRATLRRFLAERVSALAACDVARRSPWWRRLASAIGIPA